MEIGRKPLRPVPGGGMRRIEILDDTRSMSKRHAEFSVKTDGNAILRDLNSTNGTFLVRPGNELVRLPGGSDFAMNDDTVRLQFGDVPVDFVRFINDDATSKGDDVANLFDYALDNQPSEPEAADMSIDDILNLRAGEPTNIFNAGQVRSRAKELRQAEQQTFAPFTSPLNPLAVNDANDDDAQDAAPRDLFADAHDVAAGKIDEPAAKKEEFVPRMHDGPRHADRRNADSLVSVSELARQHRPIPSLDVAQPQESSVGATREPVSPTVSPTPSMHGEPSISTTMRPQRETATQPQDAQTPARPQQPSIWQTSMQSGVAMQPKPAQQPMPDTQTTGEPSGAEPRYDAGAPNMRPMQEPAVQPITQPGQPLDRSAQPNAVVQAAEPNMIAQPNAGAPYDASMQQPQQPNVQTTAAQTPLVHVELPRDPASAQPTQPAPSDAFAEQRNALHFDVIESALHGPDIAAPYEMTTTAAASAPADVTVPIEVAAPAHQTNFVVEATETAAESSSEDAAAQNADVDDYERFRRHDDDDAPSLDETQAFTPAFEPGSVFERVANGDFDKPKELIEAGGYTSDDARRSDDFTEQFEMARHAELLPFLAMNPTLYDDLYEWLAAQSNADIDEALSRNPGYEDYRKAVGK
ncbi:Tfp pilus assembly protein [Bifidobacterium italicum]|uniref:Tfp pilus assembly protein n=1 Tax=Bifidobacterium italicum TaxID=1960968 RepID=A0A2A2EM73_9BIFI|nr:Tfp pilus assembly protein [Bifidobacterium italicum]